MIDPKTIQAGDRGRLVIYRPNKPNAPSRSGRLASWTPEVLFLRFGGVGEPQGVVPPEAFWQCSALDPVAHGGFVVGTRRCTLPDDHQGDHVYPGSGP